jgi:hypothetical protein
MFAGWDYQQGLIKQNDWLKAAYEKGDPMGGDLPVPDAGGKPTFVVHAIKVPKSGNLDRIQIVKVWTKYGESHEKNFNAIWGGVRKPDAPFRLASALAVWHSLSPISKRVRKFQASFPLRSRGSIYSSHFVTYRTATRQNSPCRISKSLRSARIPT